MKFLGALIAMTVIGCSSESSSPDVHPFCPVGSTYEVKVHPEVSSATRDDLDFALKGWSQQLDGKFSYRISSTEESSGYEACTIHVIVASADGDTFAAAPSMRNEGSLVLASGIIALDVQEIGTRSEDRLFMTSLFFHEVGHLLGLEHDTSREHMTIMWPFITTAGTMGCEDVRRACTIWSCTPKCEGDGWVQ